MLESFVFFHLIKTGGSTIAEHVYKHAPEVLIDQEAPRFVPISDCRVYIGHNVRLDVKNHLVQPCRYITIFRDPAEWLVSIYHHDISRANRDISFEDWYSEGRANSVNTHPHSINRMYHWFSAAFCAGAKVNDVKAILSSFWFVGLLEEFDNDMPHIFKRIGIPATGYVNRRVKGEYDEIDKILIKNTYTLTDEMRETIYAENPLDVEIYEYAKGLHAETRGNLWL